MDRRVGAELNERGVLVWYDPARAWQPWIQTAHCESSPGEEATAAQVTIGGRDAHLVVSTGSHYEVLQACEPLVSGSEPPRLLVYVPGEPYLEMLSPLRELECLGGEKEPYQRELTQVARQALQSAGLSESKIDELLNRDGLDFAYLDSISVGDGGASPLAPVFGSSRELDVFPSFLGEPGRRAEAAEKGLLPEVARLASQGLGLQIPEQPDAESMVGRIASALLVAEMRSDLDGPEPVAISQIAGPTSGEQIERVRAVCRKLRSEHPDVYESLADKVERDLGLPQAEIDPETLGQIDTFRFEEQRLLEACDRHLAEGEADRALSIVEGRLKEGSFWASVSRYPARHAAWEAAGDLARLAIAIDEVAEALERSPANAKAWVEAYTAPGGWHRVDQCFREARYRLSRLEDAAALEGGSDHVFACYDALLERMATGFVDALQAAHWQLAGIPRQEELYERHVARRSEPVAFLLADAMRFEMGADLARLLEAIGATGLKLEPAAAVAPTITDLGMAALLPGADRAFSMAESPKGVTGAIGGKALVGSPARMEHARGAVPGLVEMTLDHLVHDLSPKKREEELRGAKVVVIRSQEIDGAGENLPSSLARTVMGTVLESLRSAVRCLSDSGIHKFVIAADHGHLFAERRGDDMKIDPPEGGKEIDKHRRCWIGKGGSTPSSCVRLTASDLGYEGTDLELVVPKGTGVFKSGGGLAFHHGGLSLQELIIPVLTFELVGKKAATKPAADLVALESVPAKITNRIFSVRLTPRQLNLIEPLRVRVKAVSGTNQTVAQATFATAGWNDADKHVTFEDAGSIDVGLQLDDDTVSELRVIVVEVGTDRTLKDTAPIPVEVIQ
jgi:hypothetical protein